MTKLPTDLSGKELAKLLSKIGFVFQRQKGSRMVFVANHHLLVS
jgi:predicted RNA binding protein YcfA (HicA-like mRNA interferase family)